jgi:hypothetical protein
MKAHWIVACGWLTVLCLLAAEVNAADPPKRDWEPVELVGKASDYWFTHNWCHYYWREDFRFKLTDEKSGTEWQIISREPTPAYDWRMGTTFTNLQVDWKANPRVKVLGVKALDRIPEEFYDLPLKHPHLATVFVVQVEQAGAWKDFYVNNWFHVWGPRADKAVHAFYTDKPSPYDIYGFINGQAAPFSQKAQAIIASVKATNPRMFHGRVKTAKGTAFGYEIELIDLVGNDPKTGSGSIVYGDGKSIPKLDGRKPAK